MSDQELPTGEHADGQPSQPDNIPQPYLPSQGSLEFATGANVIPDISLVPRILPHMPAPHTHVDQNFNGGPMMLPGMALPVTPQHWYLQGGEMQRHLNRRKKFSSGMIDVTSARSQKSWDGDSAYGEATSMKSEHSIASPAQAQGGFRLCVRIPREFIDVQVNGLVNDVLMPGNVVYAMVTEPLEIKPSIGLGPVDWEIRIVPYLYVIFHVRKNNAVSFRIHTYDNNGCSNKHRSDHCIAYTGPDAPNPLSGEIDSRGKGMKKNPIQVLAPPGKELNIRSRIDFGRPIALDFHTPINPEIFGTIPLHSFKQLVKYARDSDRYWASVQQLPVALSEMALE